MRIQWVIAPRTLAAASVVLVAAFAAGCGARHVAAPAAKSPAKYTEREVLAAFRNVGLKLRNPEPNVFVVVTRLVTVEPHQGWTVAAYLYPNRSEASASFSEDAGAWSASGIASAESKNLVVVVARTGRVLTRKAHVWPMPPLAYTALHTLAHPVAP